MTATKLRDLAGVMQQFRLDVLEIDQPGQQLRLVMHRTSGTAAVIVAAPVAGTLRRTHPDGVFPPCPAGAAVLAGQIVAFVQCGLLLTPVLAPGAGCLAAWLLAEGNEVAPGAALCSVSLAG